MSQRAGAVRGLVWRRPPRDAAVAEPAAWEPAARAHIIDVDIAEDDPFLDHMVHVGVAIELADVELDSPAVRSLRAAGVALVVPLITHGELLGLLNLGPHLSAQVYSSKDRRLLDDLAGSAAPAVRIAQLVRKQGSDVPGRPRAEQDAQIAALIQQQFLPRALPELDGWEVEAFHRPARQVGGDFYDFIELPGRRTGIVIGDVSDRGVPAALTMAKTHSILRGDAPRLISPGAVLARANELLAAEMPANMFVTCLFAVLDPATGMVRFANAGHPVPYIRGVDGQVREMRARGMPLGLLPGMVYEEVETLLATGERVLLHSDGVAEAHDAGRRMFGLGRLAELAGADADPADTIQAVLEAVAGFAGPDAEQEDDITLVALARTAAGGADDALRPLLDVELPTAPGNERLAMDHLDKVLVDRLSTGALDRLRTAVAEATMNAIEHGNRNDPTLSVRLEVLADADDIVVRISDHGAGRATGIEEPDLDAKLAGRQHPRGWGLFLVRNLVDDLDDTTRDGLHTVQLRVAAKGVAHAEGR